MVAITVKPRSSRAGLAADGAGGLLVRVHAPAAEGAANQECVQVLADALGMPKTAVQIARGSKSRRKHILVAGLTAEEVRERLSAAAKGSDPR